MNTEGWHGNSTIFRGYFPGKLDNDGKVVPAEKVKGKPGKSWDEVCNLSQLELNELGDKFSTATLSGKLANIGDDIADDFLQGKTVALFKKAVTGNGIKGEYKGQDAFFFFRSRSSNA